MKSIFTYDANPDVLNDNEFEYKYNRNILSLDEVRQVYIYFLFLIYFLFAIETTWWERYEGNIYISRRVTIGITR